MSKNHNESVIGILKNLLEAYSAYATGVVRLAKLETKLAVDSVINIIFLIFIILVLVFSTWASLLVMAFLYLLSLNVGVFAASAIIAAINILALVTVVLLIFHFKKNLYFTATRKHMFGPLKRRSHYEQIEKTNRRN